jgi:hypothetical protein
MLRNVILLSVLAFAVPTMPGQQKPTGQQDARKSQHDTKQTDAPAAPVTNNQATSYYEQPRENKPQGWQKFVAWPEGITAWAIMFTLGAIIWQAWETRKASEAAAEGANAAKDGVAISLNAERAWIVDQATPIANLPHPGMPLKAFVTLTNQGRIPARVTDLKIRFHMIDPYAEPSVPEHPVYDMEPFQFLELGTSGLVIAPQQSVIFNQSLEGLTLTAIQREVLYNNPPHLALLLYGLVTYDNGFEKGLITQFCYTWKRGEMRRVGPSGYNDAT